MYSAGIPVSCTLSAWYSLACSSYKKPQLNPECLLLNSPVALAVYNPTELQNWLGYEIHIDNMTSVIVSLNYLSVLSFSKYWIYKVVIPRLVDSGCKTAVQVWGLAKQIQNFIYIGKSTEGGHLNSL